MIDILYYIIEQHTGQLAKETMEIEDKINFIAYASIPSAALSIVGSTLTLVSVYRLKYNNHATTTTTTTTLTTYHRLLIGISLFDLMISISMVVGSIPMPKEMSNMGFPQARGNTITCTTQGFFLTWGLTSFGLSSMLTIYYVLVIRYNMSNEYISKHVEPYLFIIPILYQTIGAFMGIVWEIYNPNAPWCWTGTYPRGCTEIPDIDCIRGEQYHSIAAILFALVPITISATILLVCLLIVIFTVLQRHANNRRYIFTTNTTTNVGGGGGGDGSGGSGSGTTTSHVGMSSTLAAANSSSIRRLFAMTRGRQSSSTMDGVRGVRGSVRGVVRSADTQRARRVIVQCILFAVTTFNSVIWLDLNIMFSYTNVPIDYIGKQFWFLILGLLTLPLQGLFNFLIFVRPRYMTNRISREYNTKGRFIALYDAIWNPKPLLNNNNTRGRGGGGGGGGSSNTSARRFGSNNNNNNANPLLSSSRNCNHPLSTTSGGGSRSGTSGVPKNSNVSSTENNEHQHEPGSPTTSNNSFNNALPHPIASPTEEDGTLPPLPPGNDDGDGTRGNEVECHPRTILEEGIEERNETKAEDA